MTIKKKRAGNSKTKRRFAQTPPSDRGGQVTKAEKQSEKTALPGGKKPKIHSDAAPKAKSKIASVVALLERSDGAALGDIVAATGWQAHSARAALTGLRKKGHTIEKSKIGGVTRYSIEVA
ncbi:DUF3489 domain-containing protein [Altererythrobacter sp. ZODW24]|uniref:DUF3489 domain-containing protein n=1 Tax=Altererythrobacter sp. ZODW24 TaxID=2185142 RepID=UPI000DF78D6B|nr:DUF3489 domain-containing protein [Altererythrobacter sp. ZODW24]